MSRTRDRESKMLKMEVRGTAKISFSGVRHFGTLASTTQDVLKIPARPLVTSQESPGNGYIHRLVPHR